MLLADRPVPATQRTVSIQGEVRERPLFRDRFVATLHFKNENTYRMTKAYMVLAFSAGKGYVEPLQLRGGESSFLMVGSFSIHYPALQDRKIAG